MDEDRKISFYSDAAHNYMVLECPPELKENYQYKMLAANQIRGLLPCGSRTIDNHDYLYYDITSRQSLTDLYDQTNDIKLTQQSAGHASSTTTLNHYVNGRHSSAVSTKVITDLYKGKSCSSSWYYRSNPTSDLAWLFH